MKDEGIKILKLPCTPDNRERVLEGKHFYIRLTLRNEVATKAASLSFFQSNHFEPDVREPAYIALFDGDFFSQNAYAAFAKVNLFTPQESFTMPLGHEAEQQLTQIFERMRFAIASQYMYRHDLLRNYIYEIIHLKVKWSEGMW